MEKQEWSGMHGIFEVIKTIQFELKPSEHTRKRLPKIGWEKEFLSDTQKFFEKARVVSERLDSVLSRLRSGEIKNLQAGKNFLRHLDHVRFERLKEETKGEMWLSKILWERDARKWLGFAEPFNDKIDALRDGLSRAMRNDSAIHRSELVNQTKSDEIRAMKRSAFAIKKADLFLTGGTDNPFLQEIQVGENCEVEYFQSWQTFRKNEDAFFRACHAAYRSTKANGEVEWTKTGLNPRSLHKKADIDGIKSEMEKARSDFEEWAAKKTDWANKISEWNEKHSKDLTQETERLQKQGFSGTELNDKLEAWRERVNEGYVSGQKPSGKNKTLKTEKDFASKKRGEAKQACQALEEEWFRQQSVEFFGVLIRRRDKYFLTTAEKEDMKLLQHLAGNDDESVALTYRSLTFKALSKQARKWMNKQEERLAEKCQFSKGKGGRSQPSKEELQDYLKIFKRTLERINREESNGFSWDAKALEEIVWNGDIDAFRTFVNENCYRKEWIATDWNAVCQLDAEGKINLFQLYNQDFAVDERFVVNERDQKRTKKQPKPSEKENLHTRYWRDCFERELSHIHCGPESRLYLRPPKPENDLVDSAGKSEIGKIRFREEKIIADFQLIFYPERKVPSPKANQTILDRLSKSGIKAFIGIDRGEKSLANYVAVDETGKILCDSEGKAIKGDLTFQNTIGEFVEWECVRSDNGKGKYVEYVPLKKKNIIKDELWIPQGNWSDASVTLPLLLKAKEKLENELDPRKFRLIDSRYPNGYEDSKGIRHEVRVYDHRYAFDHARLRQRVIYEIWMRKDLQELIKRNGSTEEAETSAFVSQLLSTRELRGGYVGTFVHTISELSKRLNAVIVFEDLNTEYGGDSGEEENFLSGIREEGLSPKEKSILKGVSAYQMLEERLIQKLNYRVVKSGDGLGEQFTPKIPNLSLLRKELDESQIKNEEAKEMRHLWMEQRLGCIQYVDASNTSKTCPNCEFSPNSAINGVLRIQDGKKTIAFEYGWKTFSFDGSSPYVTQSKGRKGLWKNLESIEKLTDGTPISNISFNDKNGYFWGLFNTRPKDSGDPVMCPCCGFDTEIDEHLKSGDEVAAFNIAKRGREAFAKPLEKKPEKSNADSPTFQSNNVPRERERQYKVEKTPIFKRGKTLKTL